MTHFLHVVAHLLLMSEEQQAFILHLCWLRSALTLSQVEAAIAHLKRNNPHLKM